MGRDAAGKFNVAVDKEDNIFLVSVKEKKGPLIETGLNINDLPE